MKRTLFVFLTAALMTCVASGADAASQVSDSTDTSMLIGDESGTDEKAYAESVKAYEKMKEELHRPEEEQTMTRKLAPYALILCIITALITEAVRLNRALKARASDSHLKKTTSKEGLVFAAVLRVVIILAVVLVFYWLLGFIHFKA